MAIAPAHAVAVLATGGADPSVLERLLQRAQEQRAKSQKAGNAKGELNALMAVTDLHLLQAGLEGAVTAATEALQLARQSKDPQLELIVHLVLAYLSAASHDEVAAKGVIDDAAALLRRVGDAPWLEAAGHQLEVVQLMTRVFAGGEASRAPPLAYSLCALGHIGCATGNPDGLAAAKEALDLFEKAGDERGVAVAAYALMVGHIAAGHAEDNARQAMFLPMATRHAAAAGLAAQKANAIFRKLGIEDGVRATQHYLDMERLQLTAHLRKSQPFHYPTWQRVNPK